MKTTWPTVKLGQVLHRVERFEPRDDLAEYPFAGTYSFARGIFVGERKLGSTFALPRVQRIREGDFVYCKIMAWEGAFGIVPRQADNCVMSGAFVVYEVDRNNLSEKYLDYFFRVPAHWQTIGSQSSGTNVRRQSLHPEQFERSDIPLPPSAEQQRIVARIEELAAKIEDGRGLQKRAAEEAEGLLRAAVTKIDGGLRRRYDLTTLEQLASKEKGSLRSGPFGSALLHSEFCADGVPAIGIQDVQENQFVLTKRWNVSPEKAEELRRYTIKPRDLLVTVMGTLGRVCVVPDNVPRMVSTKHVWTITLDQSRAEPKWLSYLLTFSGTVREELLGQGTGTAIPGLNGQKIRKLSLPNVPLAEQQRIVAELDALQMQVDSLKKMQAETSAELEALMPSILDKAFRGEL